MKDYYICIKKNWWFPAFGLAFAILVYNSEKLSMVIGALIVFFSIICAFLKTSLLQESFKKKPSLIICTVISIATVVYFCLGFAKRLIYSTHFLQLFENSVFLKEILAIIVTIIFGVISVCFFSVALLALLREIRRFAVKNNFILSPKAMLKNLLNNTLWFFSGTALFLLNLQKDKYGYVAFFISVTLLALLFTQISGLTKCITSVVKPIIVVSAFSALGICFYQYKVFREYLDWNKLFFNSLKNLQIDPYMVYRIAAILLATISLVLIFTICVLIADYLKRRLLPLFCEIKNYEWTVYIIIAVAFCILSCIAFSSSNAFYDTHGITRDYDLVYTSDSLEIYKNNAFLRLYHSQNDLKQPLFMLFAAPFTGAFYLLSLPFSGVAEWIQPMLINIPQICMLVFSFVMLAKCLHLSPAERICFVAFCSSTYTVLLFSFMIEQYLITFFWMILAVYLFCENHRADTVALVGAGGTMVTSLTLLPCASDSINLKKPSSAKQVIRASEMPIFIFGYFVLMFSNCNTVFRTNYILNEITKFSSSEQVLLGNLRMYSEFIVNCFWTPSASVMPSKFFRDTSWQLNEAAAFNFAAIAIIIISAVGFWYTRSRRISKIAALWSGYSFILLCIMGWGAFENGMILYALYFGWGFFVLCFQFLKLASDLLKRKYVLPIVSGCIFVLFTIVNCSGIAEIIKFAASCYQR